MNESGYSWPEAMLTLAVMMLIFGTLLPLAFAMLGGLESKERDMRAKETMYQGALLYTSHGISGGMREEDGVQYTWRAEENRICVSYEADGQAGKVCTS